MQFRSRLSQRYLRSAIKFAPRQNAQKGIKEGSISEVPDELVSNPHTEFPKKNLVYLLIVLAAIAGSLITIFTFLATVQVGEAIALALFLAVSALLIAGYVVGLMVIGLLIMPVAKRVGTARDQRSVTKPT